MLLLGLGLKTGLGLWLEFEGRLLVLADGEKKGLGLKFGGAELKVVGLLLFKFPVGEKKGALGLKPVFDGLLNVFGGGDGIGKFFSRQVCESRYSITMMWQEKQISEQVK